VSAGASSISRLSTVIKALLDQKLADDKSYLEQCLKKIFVLCHHPQLPRHQLSWTDLSSRAAIDPGVLVEGKTESFLGEIQEKLWPSEDVSMCSFIRLSLQSKAFHQAAYNACGTLAFINPEKAIPLIVKEIEDRLSPEKYSWLTESDIQIWKGTEGVLVHDGRTPSLRANICSSTKANTQWCCKTRRQERQEYGLGGRATS
jgi:Generalcontrol nonderepressible 1 (Gcn1) N-terminal